MSKKDENTLPTSKLKEKKLKQQRSRFRSSNAKALIAATLVASAIPAIPQDVEASQLYYWDKYQTVTIKTWGEKRLNPDVRETTWQRLLPNGSILNLGEGYASYTFDQSTGEFTGVGKSEIKFDYEGFSGRDTKFYYEIIGNKLYKHVYSLQYTSSNDDSNNNLIGSYYVEEYQSELLSETHSRGNLVQSNIQAYSSYYVNDARNSDGFWYVRKGVVNTPPVTQQVGNQSLTGKGASGYVDIPVSDAEGGHLELTFSVDDPSVLQVRKDGHRIHYTALKKGSTTIRYDVYDNQGVYAGQKAFSVSVGNTAPTVGAIPNQTLAGVGQSGQVNVPNIADHDGDAVQVSFVNDTPELADVWLEGTTIKYKAKRKGTIKIRYVVKDSDGAFSQERTFNVEVGNTAPQINIEETPTFAVLDNSTTFNSKIGFNDSDEFDRPIVTAIHQQQTVISANPSSNNGVHTLTFNGMNFAEGFYNSPITFTANDGTANSATVSATFPIIKVANATNYLNDLNNHTNGANGYTPQQHELFYNGYTAVRAYEAGRTQAQYDNAVAAINALKAGTVTESATITDWNERLAIVLATVALEKAESSLVKTDFTNAVTLIDALTLQSNKDLLADRLTDLTQYHVTSDLLIPMENLIGDKAAFFAYVDSAKIKDVRTNIGLTIKSEYKKNLNERLNKVIQYFLNNNDNGTPEDLDIGGGGITNPDPTIPLTDEKLNAIYNDLKDAFEPLATIDTSGNVDLKNAQQLLNVSMALRQVMMNLDDTSVTKYKTTVTNALTDGNNVDGAKLATVTQVVDNLYAHRTNFVEDANAISATTSSIGAMTTGKAFVTDYFTKMNAAIKEVSEYNTVEFDELHSEVEKGEGQTVVATDLWESSKFRNDMQEYLDNGIPDVIVNNGKYDYIHNGTLSIKGLVSDANDTNLNATVTIGSLTGASAIVSNDEFTIGINTPTGLLRDEIQLVVADGLTEKKVTIKGSPIVHVADAEKFTDMVKALEVDRSEDFTAMADSTINSLIEILDSVSGVNLHTSPVMVQAIFNKAEMLSTQEEGQLETLVRSYVSANFLQWLFDNYQTATVDDFEFAGVVDGGKRVVNYQNIDDMRIMITDYINSHAPAIAPTPQVADYIKWANVLTAVDEANKAIDAIYDLTDLTAVTAAIDEVTKQIDDTIPAWSSVRPPVDKNLADVNIYKDALAAVIEAETKYTQEDLDDAQVLVDTVTDADAKQALQDRLDTLQAILDAIKDAIAAVVLAEDTLTTGTLDDAKAKYDLAVTAVDALADGTVKDGLNERLEEVLNVINGRTAVDYAEDNILTGSASDAQALVDDAKDKVALIDNQTEKDSLDARLDELQKVVDARNAIENAANEMVNENDGAIAQAIQNAQDKIDLISDADTKAALQAELDNLETVADALRAVILAEQKEEQAEVDTAQPLVDALTAGSTKDALDSRLEEVQKVVDGKTDVAHVESTLIRADYDKAVVTVAAISDTKATKADLEQRLADVLALINAIEAVEKAEETVSQGDKDKAQELVDALPESSKKDELNERLEDVQESIDKKSAEEKAEDAVKKAEESWDEQDVTDAQKLIDSLTDTTVQEQLQDRLDKVNDLIDAYNKANDAVTKAENDKTASNVADAQKAIDDLITLAGGTNNKTDALQDRLDKVNDYVIAEQAVERAESLLTQGAKDAAQQKVDVLDDGADKQALQDRLDKLQELIDSKGSDLLDKIIDNPQDLTGEELAEYVDPEPIYEELLDEYKNALEDLVNNNHPITKEDVVNVIRFINSLALAKREMTESTIAAYNNEYNVVAPLLTMNNYPTPVFLETIEQYVDDDSVLPNLMSIITSETGLSNVEILEAMKQIQAAKEEVTVGSYSIEYLDETGNFLHRESFTNVEFGEISIMPFLEGYELIENPSNVHSFTLDKDTDNYVFTFYMKAFEEKTTTEDTATVKGSYSVQYVDETGAIVKEELFDDVAFGQVLINPSLEGYEVVLSETDVTEFELTETSTGSTFTFVVKPVESTEVVTGSYTVNYQLADGTVIYSEMFNDVNYGIINVMTSSEQLNNQLIGMGVSTAYEIVGETTQTFELSDLTNESTVTFIVEPKAVDVLPVTPPVTPPTTSADTAGVEAGEQASYNTVRIAMLNGLTLTATTNVLNSGLFISNEHANYLTNAAFLSLEGVKTALKQGATVDAQYVEQVKQYLIANLLDGAYKEMLLAQLGMNIVDAGNGNDGIPDLTQIVPVKPTPPVTEPTPTEPAPPAVVTPPVVQPEGPGSGIIITPSEPDTPVYNPTIPYEEINKEEINKEEKGDQIIGEVVVGNDGSLSLHVDNPYQNEYELSGNGTTIKVQLDEKLIQDAVTLDIRWIYQGNDHFKLEVYADGERVDDFVADLKVAYSKNYLVKKNLDNYVAMPYQKNLNTFAFRLQTENTVYFHSNEAKFKDIAKFTDRKEAIEELAGRHILFGENESRFNPNGKVTRGQLASMIARALGLQASDTETPFADTVGKWYEKDVQALYEAGMISGVSSEAFNGNAYLTRQQAALMLNQVIEKSSTKVFHTAQQSEGKLGQLPTFADRGNIAENAKLAVARLENEGIVTGDNGYFKPQSHLTRAQIAKMLAGVLKLTGNM